MYDKGLYILSDMSDTLLHVTQTYLDTVEINDFFSYFYRKNFLWIFEDRKNFLQISEIGKIFS